MFLSASLTIVSAQSFWSDLDESTVTADYADRLIIPKRYRTLHVDLFQLRNILAGAPMEADYLQGSAGILLDFPLPGGGSSRFEVWESPIMAPELCAQFPDIRSYAGKSLDGRGDYIRFDVSPAGLHTMTRSPSRGTIYIDPYARGNTDAYICYGKKDFVNHLGKTMNCLVTEEAPEYIDQPVAERAGDCGNLRTYRLALACTGEYANFHGATGTNKAPALAAMNTSMNRVNGVFEIDCGIRMIIVANDINIIYTDPNTDPYTNDNGSTMLSQNQTTCDGVIGTANYDIGHVFSTGGGGVAYLNAPCNAAIKAGGVTGSPAPVGDDFDIDYVAHEMGHQYGADHTQYNNCNRVALSAMEPGSASTIMGYAGICPPDVQPHSDDYFHARSLQQIGTFVTTGNGNSCDVPVSNGNTSPSCAALTDKTLPISTPFILTASGSDPNNDPINYCWEQMDSYTAPAQTMPPAPTNTTGPMFRSFDPTTSPSRYFPMWDVVYNNSNTTSDWEELPSVARTMAFRVTVRDNHTNGGCTTEKNMTLTFNSSAGPFQVTQPNTVVTWPANSTQTVTWNVASTSAAPVSCANVSILITIDQGVSFTTLLASTPNDGTQTVTIPNTPAPKARIMIQAVGNYFYDISDIDFVISAPAPVEMTRFGAVYQAPSVKLSWATASEKENSGFSIERSAGDQFRFNPIGWVDGKGVASDYVFEDFDIEKGTTYYYRLKQVDVDGKETYSPVATVKTGEAQQLIVYPNPVAGSAAIQCPEGLLESEGTLQVHSADGRLVRETAWRCGASVPVEDLPAGLYHMTLAADGRYFYGKMQVE